MGKDDYLVIKEPNGSIGAPLLMEALPENRMILLIRDPRDVVASLLDANRLGDWATRRRDHTTLADDDPDEFVKQRAKTVMTPLQRAREAYEMHAGRKVLVKYEDLRYDALGTRNRIYSSLKLPLDEQHLQQVVSKRAWENIPEQRKGANKHYRKATPRRVEERPDARAGTNGRRHDCSYPQRILR